jgi:exosortase
MPQQILQQDSILSGATSLRSNSIIAYWRLLLLLTVLLLLYFPVLAALVVQWYSNPDYSHGFFVPVVSGYLIWRKRNELRQQGQDGSLWGLFVVLGSLLILLIGQLGADLFTTRIAFLGTILGIIVYFCDWRTVGALAFPLGFLLLMIPIPTVIYNEIVFPLQLLASRFASTCLDQINIIQVLREGNLLIMPNMTLQVVEACSGIRSLMSLLTLSIAYSYLAERNWVIRTVIMLATVPIAIVSNGSRVMAAAFLSYNWGPKMAEGFLHSFSGWLTFVVATLLLLLLHGILTSIAKLSRKKATA